jgi:hypothetical protein
MAIVQVLYLMMMSCLPLTSSSSSTKSTTRGYLVLYDLRIGVPLAVRAHGSNAPISRLSHYYGPGGSGRDDDDSLGGTLTLRYDCCCCC